MVDVEADDISAIIHLVCVELVKKQMVTLEKGECGPYLFITLVNNCLFSRIVAGKLLKQFWTETKTRHHYEGDRMVKSNWDMLKDFVRNCSQDVEDGAVNNNTLKKMTDTEAAVIYSGRPEFVQDQLFVLVRLKTAARMKHVTEIDDVPVRFVTFVCCGDDYDLADPNSRCSGLGYSLGSLLTDPSMVKALYHASCCNELAEAVDKHIVQSRMLPKNWNVKDLVLPPVVCVEDGTDQADEWLTYEERRETTGLVRTGKLFGGLVNDIKRKSKFYVSDFTQVNSQCISSVLFIYFATLAPLVAFGALLGKATNNREFIND